MENLGTKKTVDLLSMFILLFSLMTVAVGCSDDDDEVIDDTDEVVDDDTTDDDSTDDNELVINDYPEIAI